MRPRFPRRRTAAACLLALAAAASPAAPVVEATARVDRAEVHIGDPVRYEIAVEHPAAGRIELPAVLGNVGRFEVRDARVSSDTIPGGRLRTTHTLTLASFTLGEDTLPPQRVEYREGADPVLSFRTPATLVRVLPVSDPEMADIADIAGLEKTSRPVPWGLLALALIAAALVLRRFRRRPVAVSQPPPPPPPLDADEEALRALDLLPLPAAPEEAREFAFRLSEILRRYLGRRYGVEALEATTGELLARTEGLLPEDRQAWLAGLSGELDAVKFAAAPLAPEEAERMRRSAREFVLATRPVPDPAQPGASGEAAS